MNQPEYNMIIQDRLGNVIDEYNFKEGEFIVGRSKRCNIVLQADNVSRRHARVFTSEKGCFIEDLNSSNGVFINGKRVTESTGIDENSIIRIGDYTLFVKGNNQHQEEKLQVYGKLTGLNLVTAEEILLITEKITLIGRGKDCSIPVIDPSVSRIHTRITVENNSLVVEDLNSSNGTFLNNQKIVEKTTLNEGDRLRIGNVEFLVVIPSDTFFSEEENSYAVVKNILDEMTFAVASNIRKVVFISILTLGVLFIILFLPFFLDDRGSSFNISKIVEGMSSKLPKGSFEFKKNFQMTEAGVMLMLVQKNIEGSIRLLREYLSNSPYDEEGQRLLNKILLDRGNTQILKQAEDAYRKGDLEKAFYKLTNIQADSAFRIDARFLSLKMKNSLLGNISKSCGKINSNVCRKKLKLIHTNI